MINRYTTKEISTIFTEENKFNSWLKIELSVIEAYVSLKKIPQSAWQRICHDAKFAIEDILTIEKTTQHDYMAFIQTVMKSLQIGDNKYFHHGITASDVVDSAQSLRINEANQHIFLAIENLQKILKTIVIKNKMTPVIGRTHGMHAEITSLGLKFLNFYQDIEFCYQNLKNASQNVTKIVLSGQVGNFNLLPIEIEKFVAEKFNLKPAIVSTQVLSRVYHCQYVFQLALLVTSIEKIATEIRHLQRNEINEISEGFAKGQTGSSDMPQKKNPILCENICGLARQVKSSVFIALENINLWHERDISHSSNERIYLIDTIQLTHFILKRISKVLTNLHYNYQQMEKNIKSSWETTFSHVILLKLTKEKKWTRDQVYQFLKNATQLAIKQQKLLSEVLQADDKWPFSAQQTKKIFLKENYLLNIDKIYQEFFNFTAKN